MTLDVVLEDDGGLKARQSVAVRVTKRPTITDLSSLRVLIPQNEVSDKIRFEIGDTETASKDLVIIPATSAPDLLPLENIEIVGSGSEIHQAILTA